MCRPLPTYTCMNAQESPVTIAPEPNLKPGATASFPFDRMTVERFREAFPKARWRDDLKAWFVPGTRAAQRLDRWLGRELSTGLNHADERGRDASAFDPINSPYLEAASDLVVRTPYSRTVVAKMHEIPWAAWNSDEGVWRVPYRSWEELRRRWREIEDAARRNEPEEKKRRADERRGSPDHQRSIARAKERKLRRYPILLEAPPPTDRVVMTRSGAVHFTEITGECVEADLAHAYGFAGRAGNDLVWAMWRKPTLAELVKTWPVRALPNASALEHGWWQPTLEELRVRAAQG